MNTSHYPSLELCKKLTEIGFPETDRILSRPVGGYVSGPKAGGKFEFQIKRRPRPGDIITSNCKEEYLCPSVMEMLDVIPGEINEHYLSIVKQHDGKYDLCYQEFCVSGELYKIEGSLPDILAQTIIYLFSGNYISFTK